MIKITAYDLIHNNAFEEDLETFNRIYPNGFEGEWDTPTIINLLKFDDGEMHLPRRFLGWLLKSGLVPHLNLQGANLAWVDLRWANLEGANLQNANLEGANLEGVNLLNADMKGANVVNANIDITAINHVNSNGANLKYSKPYKPPTKSIQMPDLEGIS